MQQQAVQSASLQTVSIMTLLNKECIGATVQLASAAVLCNCCSVGTFYVSIIQQQFSSNCQWGSIGRQSKVGLGSGYTPWLLTLGDLSDMCEVQFATICKVIWKPELLVSKSGSCLHVLFVPWRMHCLACTWHHFISTNVPAKIWLGLQLQEVSQNMVTCFLLIWVSYFMFLCGTCNMG